MVIVLCTLYHIYLIARKDANTQRLGQQLLEQDISNYNQENVAQENFPKTINPSINLSFNLQTPEETVQLKRSLCDRLVLSFSVIHNTEKLLGSGDAAHLGPLSSLQLVLTFGLFASQAFSFGLLVTPQLLRNWVQTVPYQLLTSDKYWFVRAPSLWADGLVCLLGVAIVLSQFALLRSKRQSEFGYFAYLFGRWFPISAAMFGALLLLYLLPLIGDGPFWYINRNWLWPACTRPSSLVSSFLYYSNWNPTFLDYTIKDEFSVVSRLLGGERCPLSKSALSLIQCNPPTWFFSVSTQLYMLAPLVFLPLYRWPKLGLTLVLALLLVSPLATLAPSLLSGHPTFLEMTAHTSLTSIYRSYHQYTSNTFQYLTALLIGLLTGYLIEAKPNIRFGGKIVESLFWLLSLLTIGCTFAWNNTFWEFNKANDGNNALAWFVVSKFTFTGSLAYLTYMCCTSRARKCGDQLALYRNN